MRTELLHDADGLRTFVVVFDKGDDPMAGLVELAGAEGLSGAGFTAIGALRRAELGYFDRDAGDYLRTTVEQQCEVLALTGDIALSEGEPSAHAHVVLGRRDFSTLGGHLFGGQVWPTLELVLTETPAHLCKRHDPNTGLALIRPGSG